MLEVWAIIGAVSAALVVSGGRLFPQSAAAHIKRCFGAKSKVLPACFPDLFWGKMSGGEFGVSY